MKLKNLLFATMFACAFASCSSDDDPVIDNGGGEDPSVEATLEVKVATPAITRAGETDATISSLSVLVFDAASSKLEAIGTDTEGKAGKEKSVVASAITAGAKKVFVLANVKDQVSNFIPGLKKDNATTLTAFLGAHKNFESEIDGSLSMNSGIFNVDIKAGTTNYLGYTEEEVKGYKGYYLDEADNKPVKLYRNVAKVVLKKIQITANDEKYKNATLDVENVFILHANKTTMLVGADGAAWGSTVKTSYNYLNGAENANYLIWAEYMDEFSEDKIMQKYLKNDKLYDYNDIFSLNMAKEKIDRLVPWEPTTGNSSYVYENTSTDIYTLLVVKGKFKYGDITDPESRYYSVAIGKDGVAGLNELDNTYSAPTGFDGSRTTPLSGTVRNLQYNVELRVAGPGYTTPFGPKAEDDTFLDVKVEVVAFGQITQNTEIE